LDRDFSKLMRLLISAIDFMVYSLVPKEKNGAREQMTHIKTIYPKTIDGKLVIWVHLSNGETPRHTIENPENWVVECMDAIISSKKGSK